MIDLYRLENDFLRLDLSLQASQWHSLIDKRTDLDYAWKGNSAYWEGRNPTLFPFVGKLNGGHFLYDGQFYDHGNHGFARHSRFQLERYDEDNLTLSLEPNQKTAKIYPFSWSLRNHYQLDRNFLHVTTTATNYGNTTMPLTLGAHPAFACPLRPGEKYQEYQLIFAKKETLHRRIMNPDGSWQSQLQNYATTDTIPLTAHLFDDDVLAFWGVGSPSLALQGPQPDERVVLHRGNSEQLGIWAKPGAPFVCLEPWKGFGDIEGWHGNIMSRPSTYYLHEGESLNLQYALEIGLPA